MKKKISLSIIIAFVLLMQSGSNVLAAKTDPITAKIMSYNEIKTSEIKKVELCDSHIVHRLNNITIADGLSNNELYELSKASDVEIENTSLDGYQITKYTFESKEPLATITKNDGGLLYYNEDITVCSIVKDTDIAGAIRTVNNVTIQSITKYFFYSVGPGKTVRKLYETESTIGGTTNNLSKIQMTTSAAGLQRFDENGTSVGAGSESLNGHSYNVSGPGLYAEYTGTRYYYAVYDGRSSVYVTVILTLANNDVSSFNIKVI